MGAGLVSWERMQVSLFVICDGGPVILGTRDSPRHMASNVVFPHHTCGAVPLLFVLSCQESLAEEQALDDGDRITELCCPGSPPI